MKGVEMEYSNINPLINIEYIKTKPENKYFDVKSSKIKASDLAPHFSAFANAEGGIIVVGVSDKKEKQKVLKVYHMKNTMI